MLALTSATIDMVINRVRDVPYGANGSGSDAFSAVGHEAYPYDSPVARRRGKHEGEGESARVLAQRTGQEPLKDGERPERPGETTLDEEIVEVLIELQGTEQVR